MTNSTRRSFAAGIAAAPFAAIPALAAAGADQALVDLAARIPDLTARSRAALNESMRLEDIAREAREQNYPEIATSDFELFDRLLGDGATRWDAKTFKLATQQFPSGRFAKVAAYYSRLAELQPLMNEIEAANKRSDEACGYMAAEELLSDLYNEAADLIMQMEAIPATSMRGLMAKARMVASYHPDALKPEGDADDDHRVVNMIARDLLAMEAANV